VETAVKGSFELLRRMSTRRQIGSTHRLVAHAGNRHAWVAAHRHALVAAPRSEWPAQVSVIARSWSFRTNTIRRTP
jgi:tRNA threonylcarbamoyladenosine modification (KEOPS) complex Cgi121 subunit